MTQTKCPACGHAATGRFCSNCGASLPGQVKCAACGNQIPAGGRFCNQCGTPTAAAVPASGTPARPEKAAAAIPAASPAATRSRPASTVPWVIAGIAILAVAILLVMPDAQPPAAAPPQGPAAAGAEGDASQFGDASSVDLSAMTPRERADQLFNRVMQNVSAGDTTEARFFLPMAVSAYEQVPDLNADGHYHVAVLHLAAGDPAAARARSDSILSESPTHLFGLFTAAQAERALGNAAQARELYERFQQAFAAESALARSEYSEHQAVMPLMREEAERELGAG